MSNDDRLTEEQVADRANTTVERIRDLASLGILSPEDGTFARYEVMRARVVEQLEEKGIDASALAAALRSGNLTFGYLESGGRRLPRSDETFTELAGEMGISFETLRMLYVSSGLPSPDPDEHVREEDLPMLKALPVLFGAGVVEGEVLRVLRVWGERPTRRAVSDPLLPQHGRGAVPSPWPAGQRSL